MGCASRTGPKHGMKAGAVPGSALWHDGSTRLRRGEEGCGEDGVEEDGHLGVASAEEDDAGRRPGSSATGTEAAGRSRCGEEDLRG